MSDIAIIGDKESTLGFKALGFDVYDTADPAAAREILHKLAREHTAIIYLTEDLARFMSADIQQYREQIAPAITLIPSVSGTLGLGLKQIGALVEKAVGMDILKERNEVLP